MTSCTTCKQPIVGQLGVAKFSCPKCLQSEILRCAHCRKLAARYVCSHCGFEGPN